MTEHLIPKQGMWFEHALEHEIDPQHGFRPARCVITDIADPRATALPQVLYRRIDDLGEGSPNSIDVDLFGDIVLRWLTAEECAQAERQARFR
ncbi:hypothetical protein GCM10010404_76080 [Nonomuraea africana]|uniref:Uncharacterized protein n=1 Tax=Nonomuraea africana TaxID=46171 RepID=A0ABR9KPS0_9ACTN|nr:hypothetical protein [Nonomuraea africana]MBE1564020.1 hypothetical protein [Nonomuraea africana]